MTLTAFADDFETPAVRVRSWPRLPAASTRWRSAPAPQPAATTQPLLPPWAEPVVRQLESLLNFQDGWDGSGSVAPTMDTAQRVVDVLFAVAKPNTRVPKIAPVSDGTLQLVWYAGGVELEITVDAQGGIDISLFNVATQTDEEGVTLLDRRLSDAIGKLSP